MFYSLRSVHQVFCDALIGDDQHQLLFCSLWGRDTSIQQLRAMLTLPASEGGLDALEINADQSDIPMSVRKTTVFNPDRLKRLSGRVHTAQYGELVHTWLYDTKLVKPDMANRQAYLIKPVTGDNCDAQSPAFRPEDIWPMIKSLTHLPLDDAWMVPVTKTFIERGWITGNNGINLTGLSFSLGGDERQRDVEATVIHLLRTHQIS